MATKKTGITLAAEGEKEFRKAISEINADMKVLNSELKLVTSEYNKNDKSIQALNSQNKVLNEQIDKQKEKVETLRKALENSQKEYGENDSKTKKWQSSLNSAQTELNKLTDELKENEKELETASSKVEQYAEKLNKVGEKATSTGKSMTKGLTAPILGLGAASGAAWKEIDTAYDNITAGTGATGDSLEDLQKSFDNVYGNFPASSEDVSTSIADINTRFEFTGQQLEDCSTSFLKFAEVNNTDVSTAIQNVSRYMGDASIDSSQYASVLDSLTAAAQSSGIGVDKLSEMLTKYGAPMRALGIDTKESIALFSQWEKAGVNTEIAFSGMKKAISNWSASGKDAKEEFKKTLATIQSAPDIASATTLAIETFGAKAGPDLADAIKGGRFSIEEFTNVVKNSGGQLDATFENMEDAPDKAKVAVNNLKLAGADLAQTAITEFAPILTKIINGIKNLVERYRNLSKTQKEIIVKVATTIATIGPLLVIIGKISNGVSSIIKVTKSIIPIMKTLRTGATALNAVLAANPIILITAGIIALIAILVTLYMKCEWFKNGVTAIGKFIKDGFFATVDAIVDFFTKTIPETFNKTIDFFKNNWKGILLLLVNPFVGSFKLLYDNCDSFRNFIDGFVGKIKDTVKNGIDAATSFLKNLAKDGLEWGKDFIKGFVDGIKAGIGWVGDACKSVAKKAKSFLHFTVPDEGPLADADTYGPDFMKLYSDGIKDNTHLVTNAVKSVATGVKQSMQMPNLKADVTQRNGFADSMLNSLGGLQLIANIEVGGKKVATVLTPLVADNMTKRNSNKLAFRGA